MHIYKGRNINDVYLKAIQDFVESERKIMDSRAGEAIDIGQAYFEFKNAHHQILTLRNRNFNPYFAIIEAAWILQGSDLLAPLAQAIPSFRQFSDDGVTLHGAYGARMFGSNGINQIQEVIESLNRDRLTRRAVVSIFQPSDLLHKDSKDIPCNTTLFFKVREQKLDITIINRSNDVFLGIPYNAFAFNCVLKYVAKETGLTPGIQRHFTDSLHLYARDLEKAKLIALTNTMSEISNWQNFASCDYLFDSILNEGQLIINQQYERLSQDAIRKQLINFSRYRAGSAQKQGMKDFVPDDIFGLSARLWAES